MLIKTDVITNVVPRAEEKSGCLNFLFEEYDFASAYRSALRLLHARDTAYPLFIDTDVDRHGL